MTVSSEETSAANLTVSAKRAWLFALLLTLVTALAIISPFFWMGNASGHDFSFHIASWMDAAAQWRDGILLPRWTDGANHGFGEPRFIFYPPISWMFGAALGLVVPWIFVPAVFIVLTQTLAGLCSFALGRRLFPQRGALVCAVCYAANPYALLIVYMRSDFAEQLALAFFPLLFLAAAEVLGLFDPPARSARHSIVLLAITFALVWLTNAPAGVVASYSLAMLFVWAAAKKKSWRPLLHGTAALALGFGLEGFYLVPAAYEQRWVNIGQALSSGLLPSQNFLYTAINDPEHTLFNWVASTAAIALIVMTGLAAIAAHRRDTTGGAGSQPEAAWRALLLLAAATTMMMLRSSAILWQLLPKLRFVQFPWRWMSILAVAFAYFLSAAGGRGGLGWLWITAVTAVLLGTATFFVRQTWWDADDIATLEAGIAAGVGFDGVDEYDPVGDDHYNLPAKAPQVRVLPLAEPSPGSAAAKIYIDRWTAEEKSLRVESPEPARIGLRLLNYPAWRVEVNGSPVAPESAADSSQMILEIPAGHSHVRAHFARTRDRTLGGILSVISLVVALALFYAR